MNKINEVDEKEPLINRGTGAGGKNTNVNGKQFEKVTELMETLTKEYGFVKDGTKWHKEFKEKKIKINFLCKETLQFLYVYVRQRNFKKFFKLFNISDKDFNMLKHPDDSFIIVDKTKKNMHVIIVEKKVQNVSGSVIEKLYASSFFKRKYKRNLNIEGYVVNVNYILCLNDYLLKEMNRQEDVLALFEEDDIKLVTSDKYKVDYLESIVGHKFNN